MPSKDRQILNETYLKLRSQPPTSKKNLDLYLRVFYGVYLPSVIIEEGNSCPLDFVWDVYSTAMGFNEEPIYNILAMACRGGMKSLSCGVIEMLALQHDPFRNWIHMASIKEQAYVTYDYVKKISYLPLMKNVVTEPTLKETKALKTGKTLQITTATMNAVNSRHGSLIADEVDLTPAAIFQESKGMLSAEQGHLPLNIAISSRKYAIGNVQKLLNQKANEPEFPLKIHKWGILETTAKCLPERHGEFGETIYVDKDNLVAISEKEYEQIPNGSPKQSLFEKKVGYKNCLSCGIFSFCQGRLPNQTDDNPFLQPIEVTKNYFKTDETGFFKSQRLNRQPSKKGLIYPMWDELIHVRNYAAMWYIFHGESHPDLLRDPKTGRCKRNDITLAELIEVFLKNNLEFDTSSDPGFSILSANYLYAIDKSGRVYVLDEITTTGLSDSEIALEIKNKWGHLPVNFAYPDPESPSFAKELKKATGWAISHKVDKNVDNGLSTVRRFLRTPGTINDTKLYVAPSCTVLRYEMPQYHYKIDPHTNEPTEIVDKINDHGCDSLRYFLHTRFGKSPVELGFISSEKQFNPQKAHRAPTAIEASQHLSVPLNDNRSDYILDEHGKIIKKKGENEGGSSGGGSFSASF